MGDFLIGATCVAMAPLRVATSCKRPPNFDIDEHITRVLQAEWEALPDVERTEFTALLLP